jgi:putative ribosome biogenesis GTPase RsgA
MSSLERARVLSQAHELYSVATSQGEQLAQVTGRLRFLDELPAIGDWVELTPTDPPLITAIEPRTNCFTRTAAGRFWLPTSTSLFWSVASMRTAIPITWTAIWSRRANQAPAR